MFSEQHGYGQRGDVAGRTRELPRGPWVMDEKPRTVDVDDSLRQGGFGEAADMLAKIESIAQGEMPKPKSPIDLLREAGQEEAAAHLEKIQQAVTEVGQPEYADKTESNFETGDGEQFEPRDLSREDVDAGYDAAFEIQPNGERGAALALSESGPSQLAECLKKMNEPLTEHDINSALDAYSIDTGAPVLEAARFQPGESPFSGIELDPHGHEAEVLKNIEQLHVDLQDTIKQVSEAMDKGDPKKAAELTKQMAEKMRSAHGDKLPEDIEKQYEDIFATLDAAIAEANPEQSSLLRRLGSGALDFIPIAGPAKMCAEAAYGKTLGGEKLEGWSRGLHATEGIVCLIVDCTGYGAAITKGGKALVKGGKLAFGAEKLLTHSGGALSKVGVAREISQPAIKAGEFLARHPSLGRMADKGIEYVVSGRKRKLLGDIKTAGTEAITDALNDKNTEAGKHLLQIGTIHERPGMKLPPDSTFDLAQDQPETMAA